MVQYDWNECHGEAVDPRIRARGFGMMVSGFGHRVRGFGVRILGARSRVLIIFTNTVPRVLSHSKVIWLLESLLVIGVIDSSGAPPDSEP